ncbi:phosphoenolpyruvate phosphomutase family protein [[Mycobacterium] chelonae subsp. bovistauri]|nr:phosphoenolpyruvate phosphomutase family protein [Mycobacterium sp. QIA-37]
MVPNPWDAGSARILTGYGFPALATTSAGLAFSLGRQDGANLVSQAETLANASHIAAATHLPVSADLENGGPTIGDIAMTIREAAASGLVGGSIEDATGIPDAPIFPLSEAVDRITAAAHTVRDLPFPFTLTARAENFLYGRADLADTSTRLQAYADAGADVVYAPGLPDADAVRAVCAEVDRPVNLLAAGFVLNHSVDEIAHWGVRRISLGSAMARAALGAFVDGAREIAQHGTFGFANRAIPYVRKPTPCFRKPCGARTRPDTRLARGNQSDDTAAHLPEVDDPEDAAAGDQLASRAPTGHRAAATTATFRPRAKTLRLQNTLGHGNLLFTGSIGGITHTAMRCPRGRLELQATIETIAGICRPVSTGFTFGNRVPIHRVGRRDARGHGQRHRKQHIHDQTHRTPIPYPSCPVHDDLHVTAPRSSVPGEIT